MQRFVMCFFAVPLMLVMAGCGPADQPPEDAVVPAAANAAAAMPTLVRGDGTYPTKPLEKDTVVVKVIQNGVTNLQEADSVAAGLAANLERMVGFARQACTDGAKPDFLLYNEFPLTGYSTGTRDVIDPFALDQWYAVAASIEVPRRTELMGVPLSLVREADGKATVRREDSGANLTSSRDFNS